MLNTTSISLGVALLLAVVGCEAAPTKTELAVRTSVNALDFGDTLRITLINETNSDLYFDLDCYAIERRSGNNWFTPESHVNGCVPFAAVNTTLPSGATLNRAIPVWDAHDLGADVLGNFRITYVYKRERNFNAPDYVAVSNEFVVR